MHNHEIKHSQKANTKFSLLFHAKFYWLEFLVVWGFLGEKVFLITSYELPIAFPHQKIHNPKFPHLEYYSCLIFQLQFEKDHLPSLKATLNVFLGFHK
jgi:hypothetical protein